MLLEEMSNATVCYLSVNEDINFYSERVFRDAKVLRK